MSFIDDQEAAIRARAQDVALFRYRLIAPAIEPGLTGRQRGRLVRGIAGKVHAGPAGRGVQVSRKSLDRWIRAYRAGGFEALCPSPRRVLPRTEASVLELAAALKKENPERTAAQVARVIAAHGGWAPSERTLQRHFVREEIATPRGGVVHGRFEAEAPNLLWTGDVLHGPHVAGRKTYLFAFIDDHSRLIAGFRWGFSEDSLHLAEALKRAVAVRGVPARLYVDNGACFSDEALPRYCAKLGISLVHSPPYRPQGRGKIERWFETVRGQFLVEVSPDGQPAPGRQVVAGLDELNARFHTWVEHGYHLRTHTETGMTPLERWAPCQPRHVSGAELDAAFLWEAQRSVHAATATISFHGNTYEVDAALAGRRVTLTYSPFDLAGAAVPIRVSYRGTGYGTARPHLIRRHCHPKVKIPPRPAPAGEPTGISYLDLLEAQRARADGTAYSIRYHDLAEPGRPRKETRHDHRSGPRLLRVRADPLRPLPGGIPAVRLRQPQRGGRPDRVRDRHQGPGRHHRGNRGREDRGGPRRDRLPGRLPLPGHLPAQSAGRLPRDPPRRGDRAGRGAPVPPRHPHPAGRRRAGRRDRRAGPGCPCSWSTRRTCCPTTSWRPSGCSPIPTSIPPRRWRPCSPASRSCGRT